MLSPEDIPNIQQTSPAPWGREALMDCRCARDTSREGSKAGLARMSLIFSCQGLDRSGHTSGEVESCREGFFLLL